MAMDTEACNSRADASLGEYHVTDARMDAWQERGYALLRRIAGESTDPLARALAKEALRCFAQAESWEEEGERLVAFGHREVRKARESNRRVIGLAEAQRRAWAERQWGRGRNA